MLLQSQVPIQPLEAPQNTQDIKPFKNNKHSVQHKDSTPKKKCKATKKKKKLAILLQVFAIKKFL